MRNFAKRFQVVLESIQHGYERNRDQLCFGIDRLLVFLEIDDAVFRCADRDNIHAALAEFGVRRKRSDEVQLVGDDPAADFGNAERLQQQVLADGRALYEADLVRIRVDELRVVLDDTRTHRARREVGRFRELFVVHVGFDRAPRGPAQRVLAGAVEVRPLERKKASLCGSAEVGSKDESAATASSDSGRRLQPRCRQAIPGE